MKKLPKLIGVIRLLPLGGSPQTCGISPYDLLQKAGSRALSEALSLVKLGFDGILLENSGDAPFYCAHVPAETISSMAIIAGALREIDKLQIGISILKKDARAALAIASVTGCDFIRMPVFCRFSENDLSFLKGDSAFLMRERARLHADIGILANLKFKQIHPASAHHYSLAVEALNQKAIADGVIITRDFEGKTLDPLFLQILQKANETAQTYKMPLFLESPIKAEHLEVLKPSLLHGFILDASLRKSKTGDARLDLKKVKKLAQVFFEGVQHRTSHARKPKKKKK